MAIRQFEDYGFDISEKGKTITYSNTTPGFHDDYVSCSYFAVADINASSVLEAANFYSGNFLLLNNVNSRNIGVKGSFY